MYIRYWKDQGEKKEMYVSKTDILGLGLITVGGYILGGTRCAIAMNLVYAGVRLLQSAQTK